MAIMVLICHLPQVTMSCLSPSILSKVLGLPFQMKSSVLYLSRDCWNTSERNTFVKKSIDHNVSLVSIQMNLSDIKESYNPIVILPSSFNELQLSVNIVRSRNLGTKSLVLFVFPATSLPDNNDLSKFGSGIQIHQSIYFLDCQSLILTETYQIGNKIVKEDIGKFNTKTMSFSLSAISLSLSVRRSNFHGQHIVAMTDEFVGLLSLKHGYSKYAKYFESNQTYLVTDWVQGMYMDIFRTIANDLNFTFSMYKRKDGVWGGLDENNQTTGMLSNLVQGSADIIVQAFALTKMRQPLVLYAPFITMDVGSIFIRRQQMDTLDWGTFLFPFKLELWICVGIMSVFIGSWLFLGNHNLDGMVRKNF